jgi:uncharacterized protein YlxW (UPF0749 family)
MTEQIPQPRNDPSGIEPAALASEPAAALAEVDEPAPAHVTGDATAPADPGPTDVGASMTPSTVAPSTVAPSTVALSTAAAPPGPADPDGTPDDDGRPGWARLISSLRRPRLTAGAMVIAILIALLGFALIAQVKTNDSSSTLSSDRPDDLVRILSDLDSRKDRLNTEITSLQETQRQLSSGAESKQAALDAATERADELGILAGTLPAVGPGIVIVLRPSKSAISATDLLETVEELRGAGAEAMQITGGNGPSVRIIAPTWFVDGTNGVIASGVQLTGTLTITVIGDAQTMQTALTIPGGVDDSVQQDGGTVLVAQPGTVRVATLASPTSTKYAHPVS